MMHGSVWYCNDCEQTFDQPKNTHEGGYPEEPTYKCPFCGSDDYQLAEWCAECETLHKQKDLTWGFCPDCLDKLMRERGHEFIASDPSLVDDFAWFMHKRMSERKGVSA